MAKINKKDTRNKFYLRFKISCSALIFSSSLIGYGFISNDVGEAKSSTIFNIEQKANDADSIAQKIKEAKQKITSMDNLSVDKLNSYTDKIANAKDKNEIDTIVKDAQRDDKKQAQDKLNVATKENNLSEDKTSDVSKKVSEDNQSISDKLQRANESLNNKKASIAKDKNTLNETSLQQKSSDNMNRDTDEQLDSLLNKVEKKQSATGKVENHQLNDNESSLVGLIDRVENDKMMENIDNKHDQSDDALKDDISSTVNNKIQEHANDSNDIQLTKSKLDDYVGNKEQNLQQLKQKVAERESLTKTEKSNLSQAINKTQEKLKNQNDVILSRLKSNKDKQQAVKDMIHSVYNDKDAQSIIVNINTSGKSDKQIASQIMSQLDGLSAISSDDILKSMLDKSDDKHGLIKSLLATKFDDNKAEQLANKIMQSKPNNAQLLDFLQHNFHGSSDDILNSILNQADDKRQAIKTILESKFDKAKADALASVIAKKANTKDDLLNLVQAGLNNKLDDLLKADKKLSDVKNMLRGMINPLNNIPSLSNPLDNLLNKGINIPSLGGKSNLLDRPSLFDSLLSGGNPLDNIKGLPNPSPGKALSLGNDSDGLLSGLFDDNGDFSLPKTGTVIKNSTVPVGVVLLIIGVSVILFARRRNSKNNHN